MSHTDYRGTTVPDPDDPLLPGLHTAFATAGVITRAASVAAARLAVTTAVAAGETVSSSRPMYFDIGGVFYKHNGADLVPFNEVETIEQTYSLGTLLTVTKDQYSTMITSSLPARPYDRQVQCWGTAYGAVTGTVDLDIRIRGGDDVLARFVAGTGASQSVTNYGLIPAGVSPGITLGVRGGSSGGTAQMATDGRLNRLVVTATPITMAG
ncbi:hypothetical protein [Oerskovia sp. Root22]|uniref:hypothetical protein n=1 Tax=Oerskovia sp. Root22 TaxID=1736494 RepID=UPI0006F543D2|nr:hypothetical protein [Oerskovia sp. Root22]KRC37534.1 hypothetical protein ASE15_05315 [Oerskovia sp. Root22]